MRRRDISKTLLAVAASSVGTDSKAADVKPDYGRWPSPWQDISRFIPDNTGKVDVAAQMR